MKQKNSELIEKFEVMANWMINDTERAMFDAKANFLVAQGLLNYTEVIGSFLLPDGKCGERFDAFLVEMGIPYRELLKRIHKRKSNPHVVYDDLRCGLTHEYVIKRKIFKVYNSANRLTANEINDLKIKVDGKEVNCDAGIIHSSTGNKKTWHFINPKYWLDFRDSLKAYILRVKDKKNIELRKAFFKRAREINFLEFEI